MKQYFKCFAMLASIIIMLCLPYLAHAQPDPGDCPTCVPIDGGLGFLIAAGVAYGIKKAKSSMKKQTITEGQ